MKCFLITFCLLIALSWSCSAQDSQHVILVSFDGFRHDYVTKYNPPNFREFIKNGVSTPGLIPSFPSKTFPNHYSIVTGLAPGNHGLVDNLFYDQENKVTYEMGNRKLVEQPRYYGGVPLWVLARQHGMKSASYFWVGSEVSDSSRRPDYYYRYNESVPNGKRVDQVIKWLSLEEKQRPRFIALYFSLVDTEGHNSGPDSELTKESVLEADQLLGKLVDGVQKTGLPVNIVVVSDHGMYKLARKDETWITLADLFDITNPAVIYKNNGAHVHLYTSDPDSLFAILKKKENHFTVLRKLDYPEQWQYQNARTGDLLLLAHPGFYIQATRPFGPGRNAGTSFGVHGYDPFTTPEMRGIFYAAGPAIKSGVVIPAFQNVHIYPFIAEILGITPPKTDGEAAILRNALR